MAATVDCDMVSATIGKRGFKDLDYVDDVSLLFEMVEVYSYR